MRKRTREILALALLVLLAVVGVGAMAWYMLVGHNWNVAASNIDDSIGQMDGYTVILYEGTRPLSADSAGQDRDADIEEVAVDYRAKGANVFKVKASDLLRHREPYIMSTNGKRLGFFSVANAELRSHVRADAAYLVDSGVDYVVALSNDLTLGDLSAEGVVNGLSVIIFESHGDDAENGVYRGSAYCVRSPEAGEVGAVIISPSGVCSTKSFGRS